MTHGLLTWNKWVTGYQTTKETNNQNNVLFKVVADALVLCKQDDTNATSAADVEQIINRLANIAVNEITETMTCSKLTANALELCQQDDTDDFCADDTGKISK